MRGKKYLLIRRIIMDFELERERLTDLFHKESELLIELSIVQYEIKQLVEEHN
jgi:hypothetical protein